MTVVTIPKPLRDKLGNEATEALVEVLNRLSDDTRNDVLTLAEERFVRRLSESISALRQELKEDIRQLSIQVEKNHTNMIKWMFIFWIGQATVIIGLLVALIKVLK
ncbi:MAG: LA_3696 family protein [bacterium]